VRTRGRTHGLRMVARPLRCRKAHRCCASRNSLGPRATQKRVLRPPSRGTPRTLTHTTGAIFSTGIAVVAQRRSSGVPAACCRKVLARAFLPASSWRVLVKPSVSDTSTAGMTPWTGPIAMLPGPGRMQVLPWSCAARG